MPIKQKVNLFDPADLPEIPKHYVNVTDGDKLGWLIDDLKDNEITHIAFDTETNALGRKAQVFGFSVTVGINDKVVRTYWYRFDHNDDEFNAIVVDEVIKEIFNRTDKTVIMHNGSFDIMAIANTFNVFFDRDKFQDTLIFAELIRYKVKTGKLKELGQTLLNHVDRYDYHIKNWFKDAGYKVDEIRYDDVPDLIMFPYACTDTELTYRLWFRLKQEYVGEPASLQELYKLERQIVPIVANMQHFGLLVDVEYLQDLYLKLNNHIEALMEEFRQAWGKNFNPNSFKQMEQILYGDDESLNQLGLPVLYYTASGAGKTDADTLKTLAERFDKPLLQKLSEYGRLSHMQNNFVQNILINSMKHEDGSATIHTEYRQIINTGRFASKNINLQNMPNDALAKTKMDGEVVSIRRAFICPKNFVYVKADYAAQELRILGNASGDQKFQQMVLDGVDLHSWLAKELYNYECWYEREADAFDASQLAEWDEKAKSELSQKWDLNWVYWAIKSKASEELSYRRTMVKICSFEIYYGAGVDKISKTHKIKKDDAQRLKDICFSTFTTVAAWRQQIINQATQYKKVKTMFGRVIEIEKERVWTQSVNAIVQGTGADYLKHAMVSLHNCLQGTGARISATVHDEIQLFVPKDKEREILSIVVDCMERRYLPEDVAPLPMLCEVSRSDRSWYDMKEIK